jgi:7-cyano-7-deazaguanine synthase
MERPVSEKAIVLLSGGLDSTVSLWWAMAQRWNCSALGFEYGQRHHRETGHAKKVARLARVNYQGVKFRLPWSHSSLTSRSARLPHRAAEKIPARIPSTYVPGRNTLFLSFAMSFADQIGATRLVIGANAIDYSGYPDCRGPFLNAFETVAKHGTRMGTELKRSIKIEAPLLKLTKADIVKLGVKLDAPMHLTWSCYQGGSRPCGRCDSCVLRAKGFAEAGHPDPALR